jgi:hypothetical protein
MLAATSSTEPTPSTPTTSAEAAATLLAETRQVLASPDQPKPEIRQELSNTIAQLQQALQQLPSDYADEAEAVADAVSQAIDYLTRPKPNRLSIEIAEDGMEQAAMHLATILPVAVEHIRTINQHIELLMV